MKNLLLILALFVGNAFAIPKCPYEDDTCADGLAGIFSKNSCSRRGSEWKHCSIEKNYLNGNKFIGEIKNGHIRKGVWFYEQKSVETDLDVFRDERTGEPDYSGVPRDLTRFYSVKINYKDGRKYEGEAIIPNTCIEEHNCVSDLIPHGKGKLTYQYGIYEGEYRNGLREGQGTINYKNKSKYVGVFKNNQKHEGKYIYPASEKSAIDAEESQQGFLASFLDGFFDATSEGLSLASQQMIYDSLNSNNDRNESKRIECLEQKVKRLERDTRKRVCDDYGNCTYEVPMFSGMFDSGKGC